MTVLTADALSLRRGGRLVLDAVSLTARAAEFIAVIGPNGAGKSTLLSALAGILKPDSGAVLLDGKPIAQLPRREFARRRAYLPQNPRCDWPISVERLVALGLTPVLPSFGGLPRSFAPRIDAALKECDLLSQRDQPATTLSGGELARAMLARALVGDPDILIADEPMTGLDPRHALDTAFRLAALARKGKLVLAAIHDLTLAARYASRVMVLDQGRIVADGPREAVLTSWRLREVFAVDAKIVETPSGPYVDYGHGP